MGISLPCGFFRRCSSLASAVSQYVRVPLSGLITITFPCSFTFSSVKLFLDTNSSTDYLLHKGYRVQGAGYRVQSARYSIVSKYEMRYSDGRTDGTFRMP